MRKRRDSKLTVSVPVVALFYKIAGNGFESALRFIYIKLRPLLLHSLCSLRRRDSVTNNFCENFRDPASLAPASLRLSSPPHTQSSLRVLLRFRGLKRRRGDSNPQVLADAAFRKRSVTNSGHSSVRYKLAFFVNFGNMWRTFKPNLNQFGPIV